MRVQDLKEDSNSHIAFTFGRFNPPTIGHEKLINAVMFPTANISNDKMRTILEIVVSLYDEGWENITMVVGDDRIADFDRMLNTYNGVEGKAHGYYNFDSINVVSAGQRDPDADGADGMSASKMRAAAVANNYDNFKQGLPSTFEHGEQLFKDVQQGMNL